MESDDKNTSYRLINWLELVKSQWGDAYYEPDVSYEWSNKREFKDTQKAPGQT